MPDTSLKPRDENAFIVELIAAVDRIFEYTREGPKVFRQSELIQDAVALNLRVIGDSVKGLSEETRVKAPEIPWRQFVGMGDRLIQAYRDVDLDLVWQVIEDELPELRHAAERLRG